MQLVILIGLETMLRGSAMFECKSWCESDFKGGNNQGRHCPPGDMASLCGSCSFCQSPPAPIPGGGETCEDQLGNLACEGQFGNEVCSTCGERIQWLVQNLGMSESAARQQIADEFISVCGACGAGGLPVFEYDGYSQVWEDEFNYK